MHPFQHMVRISMVVSVVATLAGHARGAEREWLSLCSKCLNPSVTSKSGIGTAHAVAEGTIDRIEAEGWCENWEPGTKRADCVRSQLSTGESRKTYRATADCTRGQITSIDGNTYTQAGVWTDDVGKGRTRWRDAAGAIETVSKENRTSLWSDRSPLNAAAPATRGRIVRR
jgi:hypothetical protein